MANKLIQILSNGLMQFVDVLIDASSITTGTIDPARLPPTGGVVVASGDITTLTSAQQALIVQGTEVVLGSNGMSYVYTGAGSKTDLASYIALTTVVGWNSVTGKPASVTAIGALTPIADAFAYFTNTTTAALTTITSFARSLLSASDASSGRAILGAAPSVTGGYLPLSGGTMAATAVVTFPGAFGGAVLRDYTGSSAGNGFFSIYPSGVTAGASNFAFAVQSNGANTVINSGTNLYLDIGGTPVATVTPAGMEVTGNIGASGLAGTGTRAIGADPSGNLAAIGMSDTGGAISAPSRFMLSLGFQANHAASDSVGSGSSMALQDATIPTKSWLMQLGASNTLDFWNYGGSWAKKAQILADGSLVSAALSGSGSRAIATDASGKLVANPTISLDAGQSTGSSTSEVTLFAGSYRIGASKIAINAYTDAVPGTYTIKCKDSGITILNEIVTVTGQAQFIMIEICINGYDAIYKMSVGANGSAASSKIVYPVFTGTATGNLTITGQCSVSTGGGLVLRNVITSQGG